MGSLSFRCVLSILFAGSFVAAAAGAQRRIAPEAVRDQWRSLSRSPSVVDSGGLRFNRFPDGEGVGLAWTDKVDFADGEIDVDVRGRDVFQKSFVGVMFRATADTSFDLVYLRPFNSASPDSVRRSHAVQYTSYPGFTWERLRADHPGRYEAAAVPQPGPNDWVHVRLSLHGTNLEVYLNHSATPALHVQTLGGRTRGGVGLWVGDLSPGDFANLTLRADNADARR